ncbi:MAG: flagellar basal-body rod protein FlgF [Spirochaetes bacterium]|nr:flagellar basal-body rod protein FlgF [Spirochaetota bacterium]
MIRGLYTGAAGMLSQTYRMDVVANNLANVDKTGYKKDITIFKNFPEMLLRRTNDDGVVKFPLGSYDKMPYVGKIGTGVEVNEVYTDHAQGGLKQTENQFDLAIEGNGFFTIQTDKGDRYTRNGSFFLNNDSFLVTKDGFNVMGENGPIKVQKNNFLVSEKGEIQANQDLSNRPVVSNQENGWQNAGIVDTLKIVQFRELRELKKEGNSFYRETDYSGPPVTPNVMPKIRQGFLENSNANIVQEMVEMIEVQRAYEANSKSVTSHDMALSKLINEMAKA